MQSSNLEFDNKFCVRSTYIFPLYCNIQFFNVLLKGRKEVILMPVSVLQYIKLSLTCMCEAWEEILMQMDSRLTKFVQVL